MNTPHHSTLQLTKRVWNFAPVWFWVCVGLGCVGILASIIHWVSDGHLIYPGCLFYKTTGIFCPGCGMTRMTMALMDGNIRRAWAMNPFGVILILAITFELIDRLFRRPKILSFIRKIVHNASLWAIGVISFVILRNIPIEPFSWLAPG